MFPRKDIMKRSIWPEATRGERPPPEAVPPLFVTTVRLFREDFPRRSRAAIIVSIHRTLFSTFPFFLFLLFREIGIEERGGNTSSPTKSKPSTQYRRSALNILNRLISILIYLTLPSHNLWRWIPFRAYIRLLRGLVPYTCCV